MIVPAAIRRPIAVATVTVAVAVFGLVAARRLPVELMPDLAYPTLTVQTVYPDAAPVSVEQFVTRPVEEAVGVIPGVREMRSVSRSGLSEVMLSFDWGEEMDFAVLDVRERLGLVQLPRDAEPPRVLRYDPSLDPVMRLALVGDRPLDDLRQLAERWVKRRIEALDGVAAVRVRGGLDPEIVVEADSERLAAWGLTLDDLGSALARENVNAPGGTLRDFNAVYLVRTLHEFTDLDQLRRTVVRSGPEGTVRVGDVARVVRGHRDREEMVRLDGDEVVELAIHREGSANTIAVAGGVREALEELREELPGDLRLELMTDQSGYIASAVAQVWDAALVGGLLAVLVLYFFLRDLRATTIIGVTIPVSVIATFLPMQQAGVTLNIMSLGGLALGVGMLVDNSIVVLEAIDRRRREGLDRSDASATGAGEVAAAVTASTLTTVSVFLPIVFVEGIAGQLFRDLALTVCFSLLASLAASLTLIPALAAIGRSGAEGDREVVRLGARLTAVRRRLLVRPRGLRGWVAAPGRAVAAVLVSAGTILTWLLQRLGALLGRAASAAWGVAARLFSAVSWPAARGFDAIGRGYPPLLRRALRRPWTVVGVGVLLFAAAVAATGVLGVDLVPDLAQGEFAFQLRLPEGTPLEATAQAVAAIERRTVGDPSIDRVVTLVGMLPSAASGRQTVGENLAHLTFVLPDGADAAEEEAATAAVRRALAALPRVDAELVKPSVLSLAPPVEVRLFADDLALIAAAEERVRRAVEAVPGIRDVSTTEEPGNPEVVVALDRERAGDLGVTAEGIAASMVRSIRGETVGEFREDEERIDIRVRAEERFRDRAAEVEDLRIRLGDGSLVPVSAVADVRVGRGPAAIHRIDGARVAEVAATLGDVDLAETLDRVRRAVTAVDLPPTVGWELAGQDEELETSFSSLRLAIALAVFLVYVVMAVQFESLLHPFVILAAVPLGAIGVVAALLLTGETVTVLVLIGGVMLAGILVNNAIVLVDAVNRRRREGETLRAALEGAGRERLRPILMTTSTTVLALLPMSLGLGAGGELRAPLAITVIGGLLASTVLTLVVVPCLYAALVTALRRGVAAPDGSGLSAEAERS